MGVQNGCPKMCVQNGCPKSSKNCNVQIDIGIRADELGIGGAKWRIISPGTAARCSWNGITVRIKQD
jgi:hypothetical protein